MCKDFPGGSPSFRTFFPKLYKKYISFFYLVIEKVNQDLKHCLTINLTSYRMYGPRSVLFEKFPKKRA
jgi:hypothetical protein